MFKGKLGLKHLFAQFLSSSKSVGSIWAETKQSCHVVIRQFTLRRPLLQQLFTGRTILLVHHFLLLRRCRLRTVPVSPWRSAQNSSILTIEKLWDTCRLNHSLDRCMGKHAGNSPCSNRGYHLQPPFSPIVLFT